MKRDEIVYRPYERRDYSAALGMVLEAWDYAEWVPARAVRAMGAYYLSELLAVSGAAWIAERGGVPVGIAAARSRREPVFRPCERLRQCRALLHILLCGQGRSELMQFAKTEALDAELLAACGQAFDAELTLLIVRADSKGLGIGGSLYRRFLAYLESEALDSFCVFTDSSCDFGFYERKGLRRLAQKTFYWRDAGGGGAAFPEEYYLYGGNRGNAHLRL